MIPRTHTSGWVCFFVFLVCNLGCTPSLDSKQNPTPTSATQTSHPFAQVSPQTVTQLTLGKWDPLTQERWVATFERLAAPEQRHWQVTTPPNGLELSDRAAHGPALEHLLDALGGIRLVRKAPRTSLEALQLSPPRRVLRLQSTTPQGTLQTIEMRLGASPPKKPDQTYVKIGESPAFLATGSFFGLLEHLEAQSALYSTDPESRGFFAYRSPTWTRWKGDDVDELEVWEASGKPAPHSLLYAQREGERWTNRKHQTLRKMNAPLPDDLSSWITGLTEASAQGWVDDPKLLQAAAQLTSSDFNLKLQVTNRHGEARTLKLVDPQRLQLKNWTIGLSSERPQTLFLFPVTLRQKLRSEIALIETQRGSLKKSP